MNEQLGRPVTRHGTYTLVIDPAFPDADGKPLAKGFRKEFRVGPPDTEPIDLALWGLSPLPAMGSREPLMVSFPEPLDRGLLGRALAVTDVSGEPVEGAIEIREGETQWAFVPGEPWAAGEYLIRVAAFLEDLAGNRIGVPFEINTLEGADSGLDVDFLVLPFSIAR